MVDISGKRRKILAIVVVLCVIASGFFIGAATLFQKETEKPLYQADKKVQQGEVEVITEEALSYIPSEATGVYTVAPKTSEEAKEWWKSYQLTSKYRLDLPLNIDEIAENIKQMTLIQMPQEESFNEDIAVIIETHDEEQGDFTRDYLASSNPDNNSAVVGINENIVTIASPTNYVKMEEVLQGEASTIVDNENFIQDTQNAKDSIFWFDVSGFFENMTTEGIKEEYPEFLNNLSGNLMGFQEDTRWVGSSEDHGATWVGTFASGGYDAELQNVVEFENIAMNEFTYFDSDTGDSLDEYPAEGSIGNQDAQDASEDAQESTEGSENAQEDMGGGFMGEFQTGPSMAALDAVSVMTSKDSSQEAEENEGDSEENNGDTSITGGVVDWTTGEAAVPSQEENLEYFDTIIMFSPMGLINAVSSSGVYPTNVHMYTLRIRDNTMEVKTSYLTEDPKNEHIIDLYDEAEENTKEFLNNR